MPGALFSGEGRECRFVCRQAFAVGSRQPNVKEIRMDQPVTSTERIGDSVGAACAMIVGVLTAAAGITYLFLPEAQRLQVPGDELLPSFAADGTVLRFELLQLGLLGIFGVGAVAALSRLVATDRAGWLRWAGTIATVGFAVTAVSQFLTIERLPRVADAFVSGDAATQTALAAVWKSTLDPYALFGFGGVGFWILVLSALGLRERNRLRPLWSLGIAVGILYALVPFGQLLEVPSLIVFTGAAGGILAAVWYLWAGSVAARTR
jgi:Domain of unknown function (DUF4386)